MAGFGRHGQERPGGQEEGEQGSQRGGDVGGTRQTEFEAGRYARGDDPGRSSRHPSRAYILVPLERAGLARRDGRQDEVDGRDQGSVLYRLQAVITESTRRGRDVEGKDGQGVRL